ncbi:MAG: hypothetical protein RLZZ628_1639 [Bacteroidota bacterium]|jgi:hypothetical protein
MKYTIVCFFYLNILYGQNIDSVSRYYTYVQQAQTSIVAKNYPLALASYQQAALYLSPFGTDSYNACLCAIRCQRFEEAIPFADQLIRKGVPLSFFIKNSKLNPLTQQSVWNDYRNTQPKPTLDTALRERLEQLLELDQRYRKDDLYTRDSIRVVDAHIEKEMDTIFKTYGYPSERLIGVWIVVDTVLSGNWSPFDVLLIHQIKRKNQKYIDFLEKSVLKGLMQNTVFVMHSTNFAENPAYEFRCMKAGNTDVIRVADELYTCCCEQEQLMNRNRKRLFLSPSEHTLKMMDYQLNEGDDFIVGRTPSFYPDVVKLDAINKLKKELKEEKFILYRKIK